MSTVNQLTLYCKQRAITLTNSVIDSIGNIWYESNDNLLQGVQWSDIYKKYTDEDSIDNDFATNTRTNKVLHCMFNYTLGTFRDTNGYLGVIKTNTTNATAGYTIIPDVDITAMADITAGCLRIKHTFKDDAKNINDEYYETASGYNAFNVSACIVKDDNGVINKKASLQNLIDTINESDIFACTFEVIEKTGDAFDVKIDTRSYGDLHSIDVVSFGFNDDGTSTAGNKSTDLGLFLLANNKKAFTKTTNLATRLSNFQALTNKVGKIKFSYKQNSSATEEEETLSVELNNIQTISDIRDAFSTAIATASSATSYNGIFKKIKAVLVGDEIAFVSIDDEVGSSVSVGTTTVEADEIALYDVLYLNGATMTTGLGIKTAPVAGTNCSFEENQSIIDAIEVINSSKNDTVNIFFSNVNYSFKDIENIDKKLSGLENVTFLFVIRNALDSKYLQQYTSINDIKTGCVVVESNNVVDNECLARILTYWGSYDVSQQNTTRRFGDLIPLDITDANLSSNTQRMQEVANNGYVSCYFGKPQNQNVVGLFNNASSFGIFNVLYANYLRRLIVLSQFNFKVETQGALLAQAVITSVLSRLQDLCFRLNLNNMFSTAIPDSKLKQIATKLDIASFEEFSTNMRTLGFFIAIENPTDTLARNSLQPRVVVVCAFGQAIYGFDNRFGFIV